MRYVVVHEQGYCNLLGRFLVLNELRVRGATQVSQLFMRPSIPQNEVEITREMTKKTRSSSHHLPVHSFAICWFPAFYLDRYLLQCKLRQDTREHSRSVVRLCISGSNSPIIGAYRIEIFAFRLNILTCEKGNIYRVHIYVNDRCTRPSALSRTRACTREALSRTLHCAMKRNTTAVQ